MRNDPQWVGNKAAQILIGVRGKRPAPVQAGTTERLLCRACENSGAQLEGQVARNWTKKMVREVLDIPGNWPITQQIREGDEHWRPARGAWDGKIQRWRNVNGIAWRRLVALIAWRFAVSKKLPWNTREGDRGRLRKVAETGQEGGKVPTLF